MSSDTRTGADQHEPRDEQSRSAVCAQTDQQSRTDRGNGQPGAEHNPWREEPNKVRGGQRGHDARGRAGKQK